MKELYLSAMIKACALDSSAHPDFLTHGFGTVVSPTADVFYATLSTMLDCSDEALTTSIGYVEYCQLLRSLARVRLHKRSGRPFLISPDQPRRLYFRNVVHPGITLVANSSRIREQDFDLATIFQEPSTFPYDDGSRQHLPIHLA